MKKTILELEGVQILSKKEQFTIKGSYDNDCPLSSCCGEHGQPPCVAQ